MHRLALGLGRTVAELEETLGQAELRDWIAYWALEPWGSIRDNLHAGIIASAIYAPHVKKGKKPPNASDFLLSDARTQQEKRRAGTMKVIDWMKAQAVKKGK